MPVGFEYSVAEFMVEAASPQLTAFFSGILNDVNVAESRNRVPVLFCTQQLLRFYFYFLNFYVCIYVNVFVVVCCVSGYLERLEVGAGSPSVEVLGGFEPGSGAGNRSGVL